MSNELQLHLTYIELWVGDIIKYTGRRVEYYCDCKSIVMNYNAIVKAVIGLGYTVQKLWYRISKYSLRGGVVQIFGDDRVLELMILGSSFDVIKVYIEGATLGDGNFDEDASESDDSNSDSQSEQHLLKVSLKSSR